MQGLDLLRQEHDLIDRIFPVLEEAAWRVDHNRKELQTVFPDILDFLNNFISDCHYTREETVLFPAMAAVGVPTDSGIIFDMLDDHGKARLIFRNITEFSQRLDQAEAGPEIGAAVRIFDSLMRVHKRKEDGILFPMAAEVLSVEQMAAVSDRFGRMDEEGAPFGGSLERYAELAGRLEDVLEIEV